MIPLAEVLPDFKHPKLPTLNERNLELEVESLKRRLEKLEKWRDSYVL